VQLDGGVVKVYNNCTCIKTVTIPSLIKVLGIISRNKIYCLLNNGFAKYDLQTESVSSVNTCERSKYFLSDGMWSYTKKDLIRVSASSANYLNTRKNLTYNKLGQVVIFKTDHNSYVEAHAMNDINTNIRSVPIYLLKYE
jgi:hypothetical protein